MLSLVVALPTTAQIIGGNSPANLTENFTINQTAGYMQVEDQVDLKIWLGHSDPAQALVLNGRGLSNQTPLNGNF
jgi:hypothetical protein